MQYATGLVGDKKSTPRKILQWLFVFAVGTAATFQVYHSQFASSFDLFPGPRGDTRQSAYLIEHWYQFISGHADLLSPAMFYPVKHTLGFADVFLVYAPGYSLLRFLGYDLFTALALIVIFFCFLNFLSCYVLLKNVLKFGVLASCAGALFFAFNNPRLVQTDHLQLHPLFLVPAAVGLVVFFFLNHDRLTEMKAFIVLALAGVALDVQLLSSFYIGWFLFFASVLFIGMILPFPSTRLFILKALQIRPKAVVGSVLVLLAGFLPFMLIYWPALRSTGWYGLLPQYIPEIKSFLLMDDNNYIWGKITALILAHGSGPDWGRRVGIGLIPSMAWVVASAFSLWFILKKGAKAEPVDCGELRNASPRRLGYLFLALMVLATDLFFMLGLQFRGHTLWKLVYLVVPGGGAIRAIARYVIVLALPMAIAFSFMVQLGIEAITQRQKAFTRVSVASVLFLVVTLGLFEQLNSGEGQFYSIRAENARINRLAAKLPEDCSAFYVASASGANEGEFGEQNSMHDAMLISIKRHVPTLNGRSAKYPPGWSLRKINATEYEDLVQRWIQHYHISGNVCRLEID